jgi:hypothetical protein
LCIHYDSFSDSFPDSFPERGRDLHTSQDTAAPGVIIFGLKLTILERQTIVVLTSNTEVQEYTTNEVHSSYYLLTARQMNLWHVHAFDSPWNLWYMGLEFCGTWD